ncbi:MAG: hypothetical protein [Bacteriophage sp.]|nr:MAG: hypothetical protein [Bacteriophage sp.]
MLGVGGVDLFCGRGHLQTRKSKEIKGNQRNQGKSRRVKGINVNRGKTR